MGAPFKLLKVNDKTKWGESRWLAFCNNFATSRQRVQTSESDVARHDFKSGVLTGLTLRCTLLVPPHYVDRWQSGRLHSIETGANLSGFHGFESRPDMKAAPSMVEQLFQFLDYETVGIRKVKKRISGQWNMRASKPKMIN